MSTIARTVAAASPRPRACASLVSSDSVNARAPCEVRREGRGRRRIARGGRFGAVGRIRARAHLVGKPLDDALEDHLEPVRLGGDRVVGGSHRRGETPVEVEIRHPPTRAPVSGRRGRGNAGTSFVVRTRATTTSVVAEFPVATGARAVARRASPQAPSRERSDRARRRARGSGRDGG